PVAGAPVHVVRRVEILGGQCGRLAGDALIQCLGTRERRLRSVSPDRRATDAEERDRRAFDATAAHAQMAGGPCEGKLAVAPCNFVETTTVSGPERRQRDRRQQLVRLERGRERRQEHRTGGDRALAANALGRDGAVQRQQYGG